MSKEIPLSRDRYQISFFVIESAFARLTLALWRGMSFAIDD